MQRNATESIEYIPLKRDNFPEAVELMRKGYFSHENISKGVELNLHPEAMPELDGLCEWIAKSGLSFIARERETGKIVGVFLNQLKVKNSGQKAFLQKYMADCKHPQSKAFVRYGMVDRPGADDLYGLLRTDCLVEIVFSTVLPEFYRSGIAQRLLEMSVNITRAMALGEKEERNAFDNEPFLIERPTPAALFGLATTIKTQNMCRKRGFQTAAAEVRYDSVLYEGKSFASRIGTETSSAQLLYLKPYHLIQLTKL